MRAELDQELARRDLSPSAFQYSLITATDSDTLAFSGRLISDLERIQGLLSAIEAEQGQLCVQCSRFDKLFKLFQMEHPDRRGGYSSRGFSNQKLASGHWGLVDDLKVLLWADKHPERKMEGDYALLRSLKSRGASVSNTVETLTKEVSSADRLRAEGLDALLRPDDPRSMEKFARYLQKVGSEQVLRRQGGVLFHAILRESIQRGVVPKFLGSHEWLSEEAGRTGMGKQEILDTWINYFIGALGAIERQEGSAKRDASIEKHLGFWLQFEHDGAKDSAADHLIAQMLRMIRPELLSHDQIQRASNVLERILTGTDFRGESEMPMVSARWVVGACRRPPFNRNPLLARLSFLALQRAQVGSGDIEMLMSSFQVSKRVWGGDEKHFNVRTEVRADGHEVSGGSWLLQLSNKVRCIARRIRSEE